MIEVSIIRLPICKTTPPIKLSSISDLSLIVPFTFSEISFSYKLSDGFTSQLPYRYSVYEDKIKQRFGIGCSYKYSFKLISLKYRTKFQRTYEKQEDTEDLLRNKFTIEYKLDNNLKPYISSELIHPYDEASLKLNEFRVSFGLSVSLTKKNSIKLFYIFKQEDITKLDYDKINIFGLSYNYKMWHESRAHNDIRYIILPIRNIITNGFSNENISG